MPNFKTDINNSQGISTDFIGGNYSYPDGDPQTRAEIWQAHEDYVRGFGLRTRIDAHGVSPVAIAKDSTGLAGDVAFSKNAFFDVGFIGSPRSGEWDLMTWDGSLSDSGLRFAKSVNPEIWSFHFVDTDGSGKADTLRVKAKINN